MALHWYLCQQPQAKSSRYWDSKHSMPDNKNVFSARGWGGAHHHLLRPVWCRAAHGSISPGSAPVEQQAPGRAVPVWLSHVCQVWDTINIHRLAAAERAMRCKGTWRGCASTGRGLVGVFQSCFCSPPPVLSYPEVSEEAAPWEGSMDHCPLLMGPCFCFPAQAWPGPASGGSWSCT